MTQRSIINPFFAARTSRKATSPAPLRMPALLKPEQPIYVKLPRAPINASPVPHLTSLYSSPVAGNYGSRAYPGNCGGNLIKDLIRFYDPKSVFDPMTGSGTCRDVCREIGVYCWSSDLHEGADACDASAFPRDCFEFAWIHPPYWRQKLYTMDSRCLSRTPTLEAFLDRYRLLIANCAGALKPGGRLAILMGDYVDRDAGFVSLTHHTKVLAFELGLRQCATDIIRFSHGASSGRKVYRSSFIPGLHDVCMIFEKGAK
ncbi:hypothetical protein [Humisphaera borealis]|uniref:DNA methylase N-4/N-6 domain-containing protein n=1 Tax=Humisphaera borealis TaxID=2807512 RepID=A0A7M2X308_9BACT|nr:hypothetical protein [Humisphaera borealis]QOV92103.1 hypothetical protein IPV69_12410 [Humisphaera borealis]